MKKFVPVLLASILPLSAHAAVYNAGDVFTHSFETLSYQGVAEEFVFYDFVSVFVSAVVDFETGFSAERSFEMRLYENSDGAGSPFYSQINTESGLPSHYVGIIGFDWPAATWWDKNGRIEIEVLTGKFDIQWNSVTVNIDGLVYSSAPTVPVPGAAWLFGSALIGMAGAARRKLATA